MTNKYAIPSIPYRQLRWLVFLGLILAAHTAWADDTNYSITLVDVEQAIADQLIADGAADELEISLTGKHPRLLYSEKIPVHFEIESLDYNAKTMRWRANLAFFKNDRLDKISHIGGRYASLIEVPVLSQRLHSDDVIEASDIEWIKVPSQRLRKNTIMSEKELIGMAPKRLISELRPIRENEIHHPIIIKKGDLVQMFFQTPHMEIRTLGESMDDGAIGELIRIKNSHSEIVVQATVNGENSAIVNQPAQLASIR